MEGVVRDIKTTVNSSSKENLHFLAVRDLDEERQIHHMKPDWFRAGL